MKINNILVFFMAVLFVLPACVGSKFGSQKKDKTELNTLTPNDVLKHAVGKVSSHTPPPSLAARMDSSASGRGLASTYGGSLVSLGLNAVDSMISKSKKKYTDTWTCGKNDFYFYDQPSKDGPFDPVGMNFTGFEVNRLVKIDKHDVMAVHAKFVVDADNDTASAQIINDGTFRLKLSEINVHYAKAKVPLEKQQLNLDFEITFTTSYLTKEGQFYTDVQLGKFVYSLRRAPLDSAANPERYNRYYDSVKRRSVVTGKCFIVPRSYGYYKIIDTVKHSSSLAPYWNQGSFSVNVKVTESSKDNFTGVLLTSAGDIVNIEGGVLTGSKAKPAAKKKN